VHLFGNAHICASTVLEYSCCRIHRNVAAPSCSTSLEDYIPLNILHALTVLLDLPEDVLIDEAPGVLDEEADAHEDAVEGVAGDLRAGGRAADEAYTSIEKGNIHIEGNPGTDTS
jgi:hypothetical protein